MLDIGAAIAAFSSKQIEEAKSLIRVLQRNDISIIDFLSWELKREVKSVKSKGNRRCPMCRELLDLQGICTKKSLANIYGWKSLWYCFSCGWEEYSLHTEQEEVKKRRN